jgi:hypothetical protein
MDEASVASGSKRLFEEDNNLCWRKSSKSTFNGNCVEVATLSNCLVAVRDSKNPGPALQFSLNAWDSFIDAIKQETL